MSVKVYEINGEWLTWDHLHNVLGYTMTPSVAVSYKSAAHDTWGEDVGNGYTTDSTLPNMECFVGGETGWFSINAMAELGYYPNPNGSTVFVRDGVTSDSVFITDKAGNTYYLMREAVDEGWIIESDLEAYGWNIPSFIVVDNTSGKIVGGASTSGMSFGTVGHVLMPETDSDMVYGTVGHVTMDDAKQMITVYETGVSTESFYFTENGRNETANTDITRSDIPVYNEDGTAPAADTPYDGSPVLAFMDVDGNTKQADGESLYVANDVLRLDAPDTDEGEQWSALVEYIEPVTELTAYYDSAHSTYISLPNGSFAVMWSQSGTTIPYDASKTYAVVRVYASATDTTGVRNSGFTIRKDPNYNRLQFVNNSGSPVTFYKLTYTVS